MTGAYCSSEICEIFLNNVAPAIGIVLSLGIFLSPWKSVQEINKNGKLGVINPIP